MCPCINAVGVVSEPDPPRSVTSYVRREGTYDVTERGGSGSETTVGGSMTKQVSMATNNSSADPWPWVVSHISSATSLALLNVTWHSYWDVSYGRL